MKSDPETNKENGLQKEKMKGSRDNFSSYKKLKQFQLKEKISNIEDENGEEIRNKTTEWEEWKNAVESTQTQAIPSAKFHESYKTTKDDLWWLIFFALTIMGVLTRLHQITLPNAVVWDETHFGKMASWYINRTFFFDVHPPGGKMLLSLFGYLSGYNASHSFHAPGVSYDGYDGILHMRVGCALIGAGIVPLSFLTVWELTTSLMASAFAGLFCCYEIGWITLSKFILLDPILMFFMMASFHALCMFHRQRGRPWKRRWWLSLVYNGASLGCTLSVKFVGVFIIMAVGLYTILDLWRIFCDIRNSMMDTLKHLSARAICLIVLPVLVYVVIFFIHDQTLIYVHQISQEGLNDIGSAIYTPAFQKRLINSSLYEIKQPAETSYGSIITIRNDNLGAGYLHSHNFTYPEKHVKGSLLQITLLTHKDGNNNFRVLFPFDDPDTPDGYYFGELEVILNDNWVRLFHVETNATLACHKNRSIVATKMNLIYGRGYNLSEPGTEPPSQTNPFLDDIWIVKTENDERDEPVKTLHTRIQFINPKFKCALTWSKEKLNHKWGFHQGEASCTRNFKDPFTFWIIETVKNPVAKNVSFENVTIGFLERMVEAHQIMHFTNARLKPVDNTEHQDRPWMWPILYKIHPWYDFNFRITLMGNPLLFLLNFMSIIVTPILLLVHHYRQCRNPPLSTAEERTVNADGMTEGQFIFSIKWILVVYLFNYLPFYTMDRILYFHHYFPSQAFACLLTAVLMSRFLEAFSGYFSEERRVVVLRGCILLATLLVTLSFLLYCYVGYGIPTTWNYNPDNSTFRHLRFNENWLI